MSESIIYHLKDNWARIRAVDAGFIMEEPHRRCAGNSGGESRSSSN